MRRLASHPRWPVLLAVVLAAAAPAASGLPDASALPAPLQPWVDWVLDGDPGAACPILHGAADERRCAWPGPLELRLDEAGGRFRQIWRVDAQSTVPLPGEPAHWPMAVMVDGRPAAVVEEGGRPSLRLAPGEHRVAGVFRWKRLPPALSLPPETALLRLYRGGVPVPLPDLEPGGRLWLERPEPVPSPEIGPRSLVVQVYRRVQDGVPVRLETRLELEVGGEAREISIEGAVIPGFVPLRLEAPLPARLEADGRLRLQVRPGRFVVTVESRSREPVHALAPAPAADPWPAQEVWSFESAPALRTVRPEAAVPVDPGQAGVPPAWGALPAFRIGAAEGLRLEEVHRGAAPGEAAGLGLTRGLWLDFDGGGYTVRDTFTGAPSGSGRLEASPALGLGRVAVNGEPRLVTRRGGALGDGVELRAGRLELVAEGRLERDRPLPAVGWDHDVARLTADLHLPPGWRLVAARGVDRAGGAWLTAWTLFDLFLVLVVALVAGRLWGWPTGALALGALALAYQEPGAPRHVWLHLLAAVALLRVLPAGWMRRGVELYRGAALVALAVIALPFIAEQSRAALFPALEQPWQGQEVGPRPDRARAARAPAPTLLGDAAVERMEAAPAEAPMEPLELPRLDPEARVQTGPGVPSWQWHRVGLAWDGPVTREQTLELWLLSPPGTAGLRVLAVLLIVGFALRIALSGGGIRGAPPPARRSPEGGPSAGPLPAEDSPGGGPRGEDPPPGPRSSPGRAPEAAAALVVLLPLLLAGAPAGAEIPGPELREELRERLLRPPGCAPRCAEIPHLRLEIDEAGVRLRLEIHARTAVAVPLPGSTDWLPRHFEVDGEGPASAFRDRAGRLWLRLEPGVRQVLVDGPLPEGDRLELALPLVPRRVVVSSQGWSLEGLGPDGVPEATLELRRHRAAPGPPESALEPEPLPPLLEVERTLELGLDWRVRTRVLRRSPPLGPLRAEVGLLPGETVTTTGIRVEGERARVGFAPGQTEIVWEGALERREGLLLAAGEAPGQFERWRLDVSPRWHVESDGLAPLHPQPEARPLAQWQPWPGEVVALRIERPAGVEGALVTVDGARLEQRPGLRASDVRLTLWLRSSQGGPHPVTLPEAAQVREVTMDGARLPVRLEGGQLLLPLTPGSREVRVEWAEPRGIGGRYATSPVDLGASGVDASVRLEVPASRWVLWTEGPRLGPAVLFWALLPVLAAVALALGRVARTPLGTLQWLLLGVGLTQVPLPLALVVVGWLLALDARARLGERLGKWAFDLVQIVLVALTLTALAVLLHAVQQGLLGPPEMQVAGNASSARDLRWYQDRFEGTLPEAAVHSVPLWVYRGLMLAWGLWLAFAVIGWLRWGWDCFGAGGLWRRLRAPRREVLATAPEPAGPEPDHRPAGS